MHLISWNPFFCSNIWFTTLTLPAIGLFVVLLTTFCSTYAFRQPASPVLISRRLPRFLSGKEFIEGHFCLCKTLLSLMRLEGCSQECLASWPSCQKTLANDRQEEQTGLWCETCLFLLNLENVFHKIRF